MKKYALFLLVIGMVAVFLGCSKKSEPLEEMQQPMSPDDINRLKSQPSAAQEPGMTLTSASGVETNLEPLPPSGPYKPSAKDIQAALQAAGFYTGSIDGKIGPKTQAAIEEFQKANGLTPDGKVGTRTWAVLGKYLGAKSTGAQSAD